jgi:ABC-type Na+ efflux pump permease subunit
METTKPEAWNTPNKPIPVFNVDPIVVLILGFITCGLYLIYWNIKVAEVLNAVAEREVISSPIAIFAGCCYPVNVYFFYLAGKEGLPQVYKRIGYPQKDDSMLLIILGLFFPMVAAMIVQNDINRLYN